MRERLDVFLAGQSFEPTGDFVPPEDRGKIAATASQVLLIDSSRGRGMEAISPQLERHHSTDSLSRAVRDHTTSQVVHASVGQ